MLFSAAAAAQTSLADPGYGVWQGFNRRRTEIRDGLLNRLEDLQPFLAEAIDVVERELGTSGSK